MTRHPNRPAAGALVASMCLALCWAALAFAAESTRRYEVDIQEQPLGEALQQFSQQTQLQFGYLPTSPEEEQLVVGPVKGLLTAAEVLTKLLPAGFTFAWINPRTISIVSPPENLPPGGVKETAVAKDRQQSERSENEVRSMANGGGKSGSPRGPYEFDWRMTVEGKRIFNSVFDSLDLDIPATVFDREDIDASGASGLVDLFRNVTQQLNIKPDSYLGEGTQFADLRGLGFDSTLVLINGRRAGATASALTVNAFDLNSIPLGMVERIEIVSDSTSAIHGADAIGGVVNIALRDSVPEPRLDIDYGAAAGGAVERHAAFAASGAKGRARGSIVLDYFDRSPLLGEERDRWNNQNFTRYNSVDWRSPTSSPGNVRSLTLENLPGVSSSVATIPVASHDATLTPADFQSTAGQRNLTSLYRYRAVGFAGTRRGVTAHGEYRLAPQVSAYAELLYVNRENVAQFEPPALTSAVVGAANPYNPFGVDVAVDALLTDLGPRTLTRNAELFRAAGGVGGQIGEWSWDASLQRTRDDATTVQTGNLDQVRVAETLISANPHYALNLFGDIANDQALLDSLLAEPSRSHFRTQGIQSIATVRGPLASLPAGILEVTFGGEWREERAKYDMALPVDLSGSHERFVRAAFGELRVPVINEAARIPGAHELALVLSGRFDDYSDAGQTFNPEYALIWRPAAALAVRAAVAQGFRPPSLADLHLPIVDTALPIGDLVRNGEFVVPIWRAGGNSDLQASDADSMSVGLRFAPQGARAVRLGANYWRIEIDETIGIPSPERLLAAERFFPERIVRGQPTPADLQAGLPGPLQLIDIRRMNFGSVKTSGADANGSVTLNTSIGTFRPELSVTWVHEFTTSDLFAGSQVSRVGVANLQGTIPRWRAAAAVSWSHQAFGLSGTLRYVPSYADVDVLGVRNGRRVPAQTIVDAQLSVDLGRVIGEQSSWQGFEIRAGASNLFNVTPSFAEVIGPAGFDTTQADLKKRFAYLKVAKRF
jgi:iron complex outermembrane recepter protein